MSLRTISLVLIACVTVGCGAPRSDEPTTAKEKQQRAADSSGVVEVQPKQRPGWRYTGDRENCFFVFGRRCFKTETAACTAARCGSGGTCETTGAGPARVACVK
jgi:hypothetical protein